MPRSVQPLRTSEQREFHDIAARNGALPLEMLEQQVQAYISRR
jgi:uncharacterized protein (DUF885 family)